MGYFLSVPGCGLCNGTLSADCNADMTANVKLGSKTDARGVTTRIPTTALNRLLSKNLFERRQPARCRLLSIHSAANVLVVSQVGGPDRRLHFPPHDQSLRVVGGYTRRDVLCERASVRSRSAYQYAAPSAPAPTALLSCSSFDFQYCYESGRRSLACSNGVTNACGRVRRTPQHALLFSQTFVMAAGP